MAAKTEDTPQASSIFDPAFLNDIFSVLTSSKNVGVVKPAPIIVVNSGGGGSGNGTGAQDQTAAPATQSMPSRSGLLANMQGTANQKIKPAEQTATDAQPVTGMPDLWSGILAQMGQWAQPQPGAVEQQQADQKKSGKGQKKESNGLGNLINMISGNGDGSSGAEKSVDAITKILALLAG